MPKPTGHTTHTTNQDPHLELAILILRGIPLARRESWMQHNMPRTYGMLAASAMYGPVVSRENSSTHLMTHGPSIDFFRPGLI
jgi:hypothetical protein